MLLYGLRGRDARVVYAYLRCSTCLTMIYLKLSDRYRLSPLLRRRDVANVW